MIGRALLACGLTLICANAHAATPDSPEARWAAVLACADRPDEHSRHSCVDDVLREAGALTSRQDLRDQRQRFGEEAPKSLRPEPKTLDVKILTVSAARDGNLTFTTEDGGAWRQTETRHFARTPQAGDTLSIQRGPVGNFLCEVNGRSGFRCARNR